MEESMSAETGLVADKIYIRCFKTFRSVAGDPIANISQPIDIIKQALITQIRKKAHLPHLICPIGDRMEIKLICSTVLICVAYHIQIQSVLYLFFFSFGVGI